MQHETSLILLRMLSSSKSRRLWTDVLVQTRLRLAEALHQTTLAASSARALIEAVCRHAKVLHLAHATPEAFCEADNNVGVLLVLCIRPDFCLEPLVSVLYDSL